MIHLEKSQPAPQCLAIEKTKASGSYNCGDVLDRLRSDFKNKCYICEVNEPHSINIEHFKPHRSNKNLKFDWNNLFYCCGHCNNSKLAKLEYDEILNCTIETDKVETKIKYHIDPFPLEKPTITAMDNSLKTQNTVNLLEEVYNGKTVLKKLESANIRKKLLTDIREFRELLFEYHGSEWDAEEKEFYKREIIKHLKPYSGFTAFKRWIVRERPWLFPDYEDYLD